MKISNFSIGIRLTVLNVLIVLAMALISGVGVNGINKTQNLFEDSYKNRQIPSLQISKIMDLMAESRAQVILATQHDPDSPWSRLHDHQVGFHLQVINDNSEKINNILSYFAGREMSAEEKDVIDKFLEAVKIYRNEGLLPIKETFASGNYVYARDVFFKKYNPSYKKIREAADNVQNFYVKASEQTIDASKNENGSIVRLLLIVSSVMALMALIFCQAMSKSITNPLRHVMSLFDKIGQGKLDNLIESNSRDEIGRLQGSLRDMQSNLLSNIERDRLIAAANLRLKTGLDNVSSCVMIADKDLNIIYLNNSVQKMLKEAEGDIRRDMPAFNAGQIIGKSIDIFHKNPPVQRRILQELKQVHRGVVKIGGRVFILTVTPVINEQGERLGTAVEWLDRTTEVAAEQEIQELVSAAVDGDFSLRLRSDNKQGFTRGLALGLNHMLDSVENSLADVSEIMDALAFGDLTRKMDGDYNGVFANLKTSINNTVDRLQSVLSEIQSASQQINQASTEIASGNSDLSRRTEMQASNIEETSSAMEEINSMVRQNADNAREANTLAERSNQVASRGGVMVKGIVQTMGDIQTSSKRIEEIIGVIDGIAFQTNILALNAAVEAARAGDQGRGFAVVASEVRSLAQRSAQAAKEIKTLISESVDKVEAGVGLVEDAGATMDEVVTSFSSVANLLAEISRASHEQSSGVGQVAQAVVQMDEATQQNAALVEEAAAASESLSEQAASLARAMAKFKTTSQGGLEGLDFSAAINVHRQWKGRLSRYVQGISDEKLDAQVVSCDDKCALGKWIYNDGKTISGDALYATLKDHHAKFHKCAGHVINLYQTGHEGEAIDVLTHDFSDCSKNTIGSLRSLREKYTG